MIRGSEKMARIIVPSPGNRIVPMSIVQVSTWADLRDAVNNPIVTEIILEDNITIPIGALGNAIIIPAGRDILLTSVPGNVYILMRVAAGQRHFIVNGTLHLENVILSGEYPIITANHGGIQVNAGGSLYMEAGSAVRNNRNTTSSQGGGITVTGVDATFTMNGGEISGNSAFTATVNQGVVGGVFVQNGATFIMNGGVVHNNEGRLGGGVTINSAATFAITDTQFIMTDGEIRNNIGTLGGGVNLERGTFTMSGGTIHNNTATGLGNPPSTILQPNRGGAGVFLQNAGRFYMEGGTIHDNSSGNNGGGVMLLAGTAFTMDGGTISGNTAIIHGGGVHITSAPFTMTDGTISNNVTINGNGGGVNVTNALFTITNGAISNNTAANNGGGIWLGTGTATANARLNMTGGEVGDNTAMYGNGGGIFTSAYVYADPLPLTAYANILAANGVFFGNSAGGGLFAPPSNYYDFSFGYLLTNYDINFIGSNPLVRITFILNGGNVGGNTSNLVYSIPLGYTIGEAQVMPTPVRPGFVLIGWTRDNNPTILSVAEVEALSINESTTFTAQWEAINYYEVIYNANGGVGSHTDIVQSGTQYMILTPEDAGISRTGYIFIGWNTMPDGSGIEYLPGEIITLMSNLTFYAQWEPINEEKECAIKIILLLFIIIYRPRKRCCCMC